MLTHKTGVDSPITKTSRGSRPPFDMPILIMIRHKNEKIKLHLGYKHGFSFSKVAFRIQKLRFVYKYSLVGYKHGFSSYKVASHLSIKLPPAFHLAIFKIFAINIAYNY